VLLRNLPRVRAQRRAHRHSCGLVFSSACFPRVLDWQCFASFGLAPISCGDLTWFSGAQSRVLRFTLSAATRNALPMLGHNQPCSVSKKSLRSAPPLSPSSHFKFAHCAIGHRRQRDGAARHDLQSHPRHHEHDGCPTAPIGNAGIVEPEK
jgi:hypothetical protein